MHRTLHERNLLRWCLRFGNTKGPLEAPRGGELDEIGVGQRSPERFVEFSLDTAELGIRLRYEFAREFAPYIGVEQEWRVGQSADYARANGEDPSVTNYVIGLRFWF